MDLGLAGRVGVVTGADGEVGAATARLLRAEGAEVLELPAGPGDAERILGTAAEPDAVDFLVTVRGRRARRRPAGRARARRDGADAGDEGDRADARRARLGADRERLPAGALGRRRGGPLPLPPLRRPLCQAGRPHVNALCVEPADDPEASAREIAFLCSARASHVAGATWTIGTAAGAID